MGNRKQRRQIKRLFKKVSNIILRKKDPRNIDLQSFFNAFYNNFEAPEDFQRPLSWGKEQKEKYFWSILMNRIEGTIVVVNVPKALLSIKRYASQNESVASISRAIQLFEDVTQRGKKYIIIDANNRASFICDLLSDNYNIPEGEYEYIPDSDDNFCGNFTVTKRNNKFSQLPEVVQEAIYSRITVLSEYVQTDWQGMSIAFLNTNSMVAPNDQEIRNAYYSEWPEFIRNLRKLHLDLLGWLFKDPTKRYAGDEFLLDCIAMDLSCIEETETQKTFEHKLNHDTPDEEEFSAYVTCKALSPKVKDEIYLLDELEGAEEYTSTFTHLHDHLAKMKRNDIKFTVSKSLIQNLFWMLCNGLQNSYDDVVEAVELHEQYLKDTSLTYSDDQATFYNACAGSSRKNMEFRYIVLTRILEEIYEDVLNVNI
tara:strand:- start:42 stop:1316 length:1275 start_codon:yes stop_codon:yes gene_type:complete